MKSFLLLSVTAAVMSLTSCSSPSMMKDTAPSCPACKSGTCTMHGEKKMM